MDEEDGGSTSTKPDNQKCCIVCKRGVRNTRDLKHCFKCNNCSHATCNSSFIYVSASNIYACPDCAKKEKITSPTTTHPSNNNTTVVVNSNTIDTTEELAGASDEEANRPSCSQSVHNSSDDDQTSRLSTKTVVGMNEEQPTAVTKSKSRKSTSTRRSRTRSSPQQQALFAPIRSNSSASEEQSSPVGNKLKTRISGSPSSSSIGISMTTAEPSNEAPTPSEISMSPESISDANNSRTTANDTTLDSQTTKQ